MSPVWSFISFIPSLADIISTLIEFMRRQDEYWFPAETEDDQTRTMLPDRSSLTSRSDETTRGMVEELSDRYWFQEYLTWR